MYCRHPMVATIIGIDTKAAVPRRGNRQSKHQLLDLMIHLS